MQVLEVLLDREVPVDMRLPAHLPAAEPTERTALTALMFTARAGSPRAVSALLQAGANPNMRDPRGVTPLMLCCQPTASAPVERRLDVAKQLLAAGAKVDARDIAGQSALMNACSRVQAPLVQLLLDAKADVSLRHGKGSTAVGVLAAGLGTDDAETCAAARGCIDAIMARASDDAGTLSLLREEVRAYGFFDVQAALMPTHNRYVETEGARNGDREAELVAELCRQLKLPDDHLTREDPAVSGGKWGNFYETLQKRLSALVPEVFLRIYDEHPAVSDFCLLTQFSTEAISAAEAKAARLAKEQFGGVRTAAFHPETLREESLIPYRHRGRVPRCMKDYQNLFVLPLRRCISHAVPTSAALKTLSKLGPLVEMGAGSGYWAAMLRERKVDVLAYARLDRKLTRTAPPLASEADPTRPPIAPARLTSRA